MNFTDHRQLKTRITVHTLYAPEKGYLSGQFSGAQPADDAQNLYNFNQKNNYNNSSIQTQGVSLPTSNNSAETTSKRASKISSNLRPLSQLQGGLLPKANKYIKAPSCTFAYGGIVPGETHPFYDYLQGPTKKQGYQVVFKNNDIKYNVQTSSIGVTAVNNRPITHTSYIPFNQYDENKILRGIPYTTYNIWDFADDYYQYVERKANKYRGPVTNQNVKNAAKIETVDDPYYGSQIAVYAADTVIKIGRMYPTSYDVLYQNPIYFYSSGSGQYSYKQLPLLGGTNCGFVLSFTTDEIKSTSVIQIEIIDQSPLSDTVNSYQFQISSEITQTLFALKPNKKDELIILGKFTNFGDITSIKELYFHFVGGLLLVGNSADSQEWEVIHPYTDVTLTESPKKYEHHISNNTYVYVTFNDIVCNFQYSPITFDHIDTNEKNVRNLYSYITARFDAPKSKSNAISMSQIKQTITDSIYYGNQYKSIDTYKHPISMYADTRIKDTSSILLNESGLSPNGNQSVYNVLTLYSIGGVDGSIYMRLDNDDSNTPTSAFNNNEIINSSSASIGAASVNTSNTYATNTAYSNRYANILEEIIGSDLSEYVLSWNVNVNSEENNKFVISKTATITLANVDSDQRGSNILDLLERNLLVIRIEAGYGEVFDTYFEGFCTGITVDKSGSGTQVNLNCVDIMSYALSNIVFENPMLITGLSLFRAIDYIVACSGFADHYLRFNGNNAFNYYGSLKLDQNSVQKQDLITCSLVDTIMDKIKDVGRLLLNKKEALPTIRWDSNYQKIIFDARFNYLDDDFKFTGLVENSAGEFLKMVSNPGVSVPEWHGLLNGKYTVEVDNTYLATGVKSFGLLRDGYKYIATPELKIENSLSISKRSFLTNSINANNLVEGWIGFRKIKTDSVDKSIVANETILKNRFRFFEKVTSETIHSISFSCYVTKPLREYGNFVINIFINDNTSQTDPYIYEKVSYAFSKENNYIVADVTGRNIILMGDF